MNLPNRLTLLRLLLTPVFVVLLGIDHAVAYAVAYAVFTVASITDYYDGKIARQRNLVTNFGKLFDPVADKVLLISAFVMLMKVRDLEVPGWTVVAIIAREFLVTGARALAAGEGTVIAANRYGKTKAVIQMVYVFVFLFFAIVGRSLVHYGVPHANTIQNVVQQTSYWAIIFVGIYTVYSGVQFARINWHSLNLDKGI